MTKKILKVCFLAVVITVLFDSCKKNDTNKSLTDQKSIEERSINALKERYKFESREINFTVNAKGQGMYTDINGNPIDWSKARTSDFACYDPADDANGDLTPIVALNSVTINFTCSGDYFIGGDWTISTPYQLLHQNPNNSTQYSKGRLRLKNSSGTFYYVDGAMSALFTQTGTETINGVDRYVYNIKTQSSAISGTTFSSAVLVQLGGFFYTDCPDVPSITIAYSNTYSKDLSNTNNLCKRTDKIWINPPSWTNGVIDTYASIAGINALGSCSGTFTANHYVTVSKISGTPYSQSFTISSTGVQTLSAAAFTTQGATIQFEYYNTGNGCTAGTEPKVKEIWNW